MLDVGCGDGQVSRLAWKLGAELVVGIDPTWNQISVAHERGGGPAYVRGPAGAATCRSPDATFDAVVACLVFEHIRDVDDAIAEVARVLRPGGVFCFFLNHPLLQTPNSGWIDDQFLDPPEQYWRIGPYLIEDETLEEVDKDVFIRFIHRPLSRYVNALAGVGLLARADGRAGAAARVHRSCRGVRARRNDPTAAVSCDRASTSRRALPDAYARPVADIVLITGMSGAGRSGTADVLEDLGWYVVDNLPTSLMDTIVELASKPGSGIERLALVSGRQHVDCPAESRRVAQRWAPGPFGVPRRDGTPELVRRYDATRRKHPLDDEADGLVEAIELERMLLEPVKAAPDLVIDTTSLNIHQLKAKLVGAFESE